MDFKIGMLLVALAMTVSCENHRFTIDGDENIVGVRVDKMSSLVSFDGRDSEEIVIFDQNTRRIHQFRLDDMGYKGALKVRQPELEHAVLAHEKGHFVIDLFDQHVSVFNKHRQVEHDPIQISGKPVSVAFRSELNLFAIYDDLNSVSLLKMDSMGNVVNQWKGGPVLGGSKSITCGDLLFNGKLALSLDNGTIALADVEQSQRTQDWNFTEFNTSLGRISWLAPIRGNNNQIFVKAGNKFAIIDLSSQTVVDSVDSSGSVEKLSKTFDAHAVVRSSGWKNEITIYYPQNSKIVKRSLQKQEFYLVSSQLNLAEGRWSYVESEKKTDWFDNSVNTVKKNRVLKMFRINDMAALKRMDVASEAQVLLSSSSLFALFPSELGLAVRYDLLSDTLKRAEMFNTDHIGSN